MQKTIGVVRNMKLFNSQAKKRNLLCMHKFYVVPTFNGNTYTSAVLGTCPPHT